MEEEEEGVVRALFRPDCCSNNWQKHPDFKNRKKNNLVLYPWFPDCPVEPSPSITHHPLWLRQARTRLSNRWKKKNRNHPLIFSDSWQFMNAPCAANASCDGGITWAVATRPLETDDVSSWSACYSLRHWGVKENSISRSDTGLKLEDGHKAQGRMLKQSPTCVFILLVNPM